MKLVFSTTGRSFDAGNSMTPDVDCLAALDIHQSSRVLGPPTYEKTTQVEVELDAEQAQALLAQLLTAEEVVLLRSALDSYEYWEHRDLLPHDSGYITVSEDQDMDAVFADTGEDEREAKAEAWEAVKAARALESKLAALIAAPADASFLG